VRHAVDMSHPQPYDFL